MPGIVGLITKMPRERAEAELLRMIEALRHECFYDSGTWIDEASGVYVGWVERKGPFSGQNPLWNEAGDIALVFSGEEFPEPGTALRPKERDHGPDAESRCHLVRRYEKDSTFPACLNGRFQGLVVDRTRGVATLFNDRYGMHRLYCHEANGVFYFSAEAKAILAVKPELRTLDVRSLGEYVSCGCVLENRTLFNGIQVVPAGAKWTFRQGETSTKGYYFQAKEWEEQAPLDAETYYHELRETFSRNLSRYFSGPERIGMSLTGGLDSRMILAWQKCPPGGLPCYSFGGTYRDCQDVLLARRVASVCKQPHQVVEVGNEFLSGFPRYAERSVYLTDGCTGVERSADLYINERARQIAPVRMTGNYGGEVLRRMRAFKPVSPVPDLYRPELLSYIETSKETYAGLLQGHPLSFAVFRQAPWYHFGLLALEETQLCMRSPFLDNDLIRTVFRAPESACINSDISLQLIADGDPELSQIRTDRGLGGGRGNITSAALRHLIEFTIKAEYAYDYGMPQWVAEIDHVLAPLHIERLFLGRHRFSHFRIWYRDRFKEYIREMLLDPRTLKRPYINPNQVESVVASHIKGDRNYTSEIHQLLTLELIHRLFLEAR